MRAVTEVARWPRTDARWYLSVDTFHQARPAMQYVDLCQTGARDAGRETREKKSVLLSFRVEGDGEWGESESGWRERVEGEGEWRGRRRVGGEREWRERESGRRRDSRLPMAAFPDLCLLLENVSKTSSSFLDVFWGLLAASVPPISLPLLLLPAMSLTLSLLIRRDAVSPVASLTRDLALSQRPRCLSGLKCLKFLGRYPSCTPQGRSRGNKSPRNSDYVAWTGGQQGHSSVEK